MKIFEFIENDLSSDENKKYVIYNKQIFILYYSFEFIKNDDNQIQRTTKFYKVPFNENVYFKEPLSAYKMKTKLYKNYIVLIDSINKSELKNKINSLKPFATIKNNIKNNKQSIINYQTQNKLEYVNRDFMTLINAIKNHQNRLSDKGEKYRQTKLKKYENLLIALNDIKPKEKELFTQKLINSEEDFIQKQYKKEFLKWTLSSDKDKIKRAIIYILNKDIQSGLNISLIDFDLKEEENKIKWNRKYYYRDLYIKLFDKYLKQTNGDKDRAKDLTMKDIKENHTRPRIAKNNNMYDY